MAEAKKVLIADFAVAVFESTTKMLLRDGVQVQAVTEPNQFLKKISTETFDVCVVNLLLGGSGPFELISKVRATSVKKDVRVIVVSRQVHRTNIQNCIKAGADDFVAEPFDPESIYRRILYHFAPKKVVADLNSTAINEAHREYLLLLLESIERVSQDDRKSEPSAVFQVLDNVARMLSSNRTSLVIVDLAANTGVILASSDDPKFKNFPINLGKYPEILHVVSTGEFVCVDDVSQNAMTSQISEQVRSIKIGSLMVFPIRFRADIIGVLTIKRPTTTELPNVMILRILQALATTLAAHSNIEFLLRRVYKDFTTKKAA